MMKKHVYLAWLIFVCNISNAQVDLQCNGRDMHSIYITTYGGQIGRIDSVDTAPTNAVLVTSTPGGSIGGISINPNLDSLAGPQTMYFNKSVNFLNYYFFWNGTGWTDTNHTTGGSTAANPGGTANYIFNLDAINNKVYRYDGTSNATLLDSNLNTFYNSVYDIATDNAGNYYIFRCVQQQEIVVFDPTGAPLDTFNTTGITEVGGGLAILGNRIYAVTSTDLYEGIQSGNNINFTLIKNIGVNVMDIATCPDAANPLAFSDDLISRNTLVYPSPFNSILNINVDGYKQYEVILYNVHSQRLLQQEFNGSVILHTDNLTKGIYFYEIRNKNGLIKNGKVVKD